MREQFKIAFGLLVLTVFSGAAFAEATPAAKPEYPWSDTKSPYGIDKRTAWTTSRVVGSPEPPRPYQTERIFPKLRFDRSLEIVNSPDGQRWFICEDPGLIHSFPKDQSVEKTDLFLDIRRKDDRYLAWNEHRRLWSIVFHPKYLSNGIVYVCYLDPKPQPGRVRISRFTVDLKNSPPVCDPESEFIMLEWISAVDHHGGCLRFGKDGFLYFSAGDGSAWGDRNNSGQDISDFNAAIMRIDVNRAQNGLTYAIPADNPFVNVPGARGEVWAYGLRNVWKMSFDKATGDLWAGDVGQDLYDMICRVEKGGNYGWSVTEGTHPYLPERKVGPTPILPPAAEHDHAEARSITGGYVYTGTRLKELTGAYVYGDYETGKFFQFRWDGKKATKPELIADTTVHITAFAEDNDGELVVLDYNGTLHRLIPNPALKEPQKPFPKLLSETGLFADVKKHEPAAALIPYNVNAPLWSDHAKKDRFIALPGDSKIDFNPNDAWRFPEGAVLVKTFAIEMKVGDPQSLRRLETRLLHYELGQWRFYTYIWNDDQSDAVLLGKDALDRPLEISDPAAPGGIRKQTWHFPSRAECTLCHNQSPGYVLGLNTPQMNRMFNYGVGADNQLRTLDHLKVFSRKLADFYKPMNTSGNADSFPRVAKLADPHDAAASLEERSRSYLQGNCTHCHRIWGGGNSTINLSHTLSLNMTNTLDAKPGHGDFDLPDARIIAPGHPEKSVLTYRMAKLGQGRMPHVASTVVDDDAVKLLQEWITKMGRK